MIPGFPVPGLDVAELTVVRHGQSLSNELLIAANQQGIASVDGLPARDADVPLSKRGEQEAAAVGRWAAALPNPPDLVIASTYLRAQLTARAAVDALDGEVEFRLDDRIRDREIGVLTLMTEAAVRAAYPDEVSAGRRPASSTTGRRAGSRTPTWRSGCAASSPTWRGTPPGAGCSSSLTIPSS
ncbi:phosphoglycerate mutase family protein [Cryptosporangium sp. NPDC051539]|uniref:phosphoglycerate mutase family protein n=1 Tax=Cryptosporangium sp. NPDC051539 TaxID=3363962 RepID=UPI0037A7C7FD